MPQKVILGKKKKKETNVQKIFVVTFNSISIFLSHTDKTLSLIPKEPLLGLI